MWEPYTQPYSITSQRPDFSLICCVMLEQIQYDCHLLLQVSMVIALFIMLRPKASTFMVATCIASTAPSSLTSCMHFIIHLASGPFYLHLKDRTHQDLTWYVFVAVDVNFSASPARLRFLGTSDPTTQHHIP